MFLYNPKNTIENHYSVPYKYFLLRINPFSLLSTDIPVDTVLINYDHKSNYGLCLRKYHSVLIVFQRTLNLSCVQRAVLHCKLSQNFWKSKLKLLQCLFTSYFNANSNNILSLIIEQDEYTTCHKIRIIQTNKKCIINRRQNFKLIHEMDSKIKYVLYLIKLDLTIDQVVNFEWNRLDHRMSEKNLTIHEKNFIKRLRKRERNRRKSQNEFDDLSLKVHSLRLEKKFLNLEKELLEEEISFYHNQIIFL